MGPSSEELKREISETRDDLGGTINAIEDRVSPSRIVQRRKSRLRERRDRMIDGVSNFKESVMGVSHDAGSAVAGRASNLKGEAAGGASKANEALHQAPGMAKREAQGQPLIAGAVAAGVGFLAALAFPPQDAEKQAARRLEQKAGPLKDTAQSVGQDVAGSLKESAGQSAQQLKESAAGSAQEVKETAQSSAQETKSAGQSAAGDVKQAAKNG